MAVPRPRPVPGWSGAVPRLETSPVHSAVLGRDSTGAFVGRSRSKNGISSYHRRAAAVPAPSPFLLVSTSVPCEPSRPAFSRVLSPQPSSHHPPWEPWAASKPCVSLIQLSSPPHISVLSLTCCSPPSSLRLRTPLCSPNHRVMIFTRSRAWNFPCLSPCLFISSHAPPSREKIMLKLASLEYLQGSAMIQDKIVQLFLRSSMQRSP